MSTELGDIIREDVSKIIKFFAKTLLVIGAGVVAGKILSDAASVDQFIILYASALSPHLWMGLYIAAVIDRVKQDRVKAYDTALRYIYTGLWIVFGGLVCSTTAGSLSASL
ncbi:MAG: hypothetical protein ACKVOE_10625 [Rickettsiales bacterium]